MKKSVLAVATLFHLLPHPFGVSSVGATALYAGAYGSPRRAWLIPLVPLTLGLAITGLYQPLVVAFVFAGYSLSTLAGRWFLSRRRTRLRYAAAVLSGAILFYAVSNVSMLLVGYFPMTWGGLAECYVAGLPYLLQSMLADAAYCFVLFGLHALLERRTPATATA